MVQTPNIPDYPTTTVSFSSPSTSSTKPTMSPPLPTIPLVGVQKHTTKASCYVTMGRNVYDVTHFVNDHPGGAELILEYAARDVTHILADEISHTHTETAYEILEDSHIAYLPAEDVAISTAKPSADAAVFAATGMSCAEDLSRETDAAGDFRTHKFLDLNRPLIMQVWRGNFSREFYLAQVHRPRHYRGGASAPLFGNFLEPLTKTPWWVVPLLWLPCVAAGTVLAYSGLTSGLLTGVHWFVGLAAWTLIEYLMHRFLFHLDAYLPDNRVGLTLHFLLHGIHHYLPMDKYRLVMPPTLFVALAIPFWHLVHLLFAYNWYAAVAVYCGGIFGYICYDLTHYFLHHRNLPAHYRELKKYHLEHHFADYQNGFGVTSRFWDRVFGTELQFPQSKVIKSN